VQTFNVNGGVVDVATANYGATNFVVAAGATLIGTGSTGTTTVNGTLAAGTATSVGALSTSALTLAGSASFSYNFVGGSNLADLLTTNGNVDLGNASLITTNLGGGSPHGDKYTLIAYNGNSLTGTFNGLADDAFFTIGGATWQINYNDTSAGLNGGSGANFVTITAVPEPSSLALVGFGLCGLSMVRRRRIACRGR
jgi:hypothetical protein